MTTLVAISGAHSTGKTTLCNTLYDIGTDMGYDVCLLGESARVILNDLGIAADATMTVETRIAIQTQILLHQYHAEHEALRCDYDAVICDRCLWDVIVYTRFHNVPQSALDSLEAMAYPWMGRYDYVALTDIDHNRFPCVADDGVRDTNVDAWYDIDAAMHEAIHPNIDICDLARVFDVDHINYGGHPRVS